MISTNMVFDEARVRAALNWIESIDEEDWVVGYATDLHDDVHDLDLKIVGEARNLPKELYDSLIYEVPLHSEVLVAMEDVYSETTDSEPKPGYFPATLIGFRWSEKLLEPKSVYYCQVYISGVLETFWSEIFRDIAIGDDAESVKELFKVTENGLKKVVMLDEGDS